MISPSPVFSPCSPDWSLSIPSLQHLWHPLSNFHSPDKSLEQSLTTSQQNTSMSLTPPLDFPSWVHPGWCSENITFQKPLEAPYCLKSKELIPQPSIWNFPWSGLNLLCSTPSWSQSQWLTIPCPHTEVSYLCVFIPLNVTKTQFTQWLSSSTCFSLWVPWMELKANPEVFPP